MAWYPGATKMELQPESDAQAAIVPTQFILHSIAAPWTTTRIYEYWRDSTNLESHFGLAYNGDIAQYIGTQTRADANMYANVRAVSLESASNLDHTDPWTTQQVEQIIRLGVWLNKTHGIPAKTPDSWDSPGMGFHSMFPKWSDGGTACPGDARRAQFYNFILPEIQRRVSGAAPLTAEDDMTPEELFDAKLPEYTRRANGYLPSAGEAFLSAFNSEERIQALAAKIDQIARALNVQ